ncbi:unnamed protein product [Closterium sp. NIES-54]
MINREHTERSHSGQRRVARYQQSITQAGQGGARLGWPVAGRAGAGRCNQQGGLAKGRLAGCQRAVRKLQGTASGPQGAASGLQGAARKLQEAASGLQG